jgi:hypothetical protein
MRIVFTKARPSSPRPPAMPRRASRKGIHSRSSWPRGKALMLLMASPNRSAQEACGEIKLGTTSSGVAPVTGDKDEGDSAAADRSRLDTQGAQRRWISRSFEGATAANAGTRSRGGFGDRARARRLLEERPRRAATAARMACFVRCEGWYGSGRSSVTNWKLSPNLPCPRLETTQEGISMSG